MGAAQEIHSHLPYSRRPDEDPGSITWLNLTQKTRVWPRHQGFMLNSDSRIRHVYQAAWAPGESWGYSLRTGSWQAPLCDSIRDSSLGAPKSCLLSGGARPMLAVPLAPECTLFESTCQAGRPSRLRGLGRAGARRRAAHHGHKGRPWPSACLLLPGGRASRAPRRQGGWCGYPGVTPERSSPDQAVLYFSLQNAGGLINLLVEGAAGRPIRHASPAPQSS